MSLIILTQVEKQYGNGFKAIDGIDLSIKKGSFVTIIGSSGSGKSTLLRTINALDPATGGQVQVDGIPADEAHRRVIRRRVAMVFQQFNLVDRLNVMTNVLTGRLAYRHSLLSLFHLFRREDVELAETALHQVGLTDKAWNRADALSGGQQQRVAIARALTQHPEVILADEPVASLDPVTSREILELLRTICDERGITVVTSLHQLDLAREFSDRVIGLQEGKLVFDGSPEQLTQTQAARIYGDIEPLSNDMPHAEPALAYT